jgi:hypothetical protein
LACQYVHSLVDFAKAALSNALVDVDYVWLYVFVVAGAQLFGALLDFV